MIYSCNAKLRCPSAQPQDLNTSRVRKRAKKVTLDPSHPAHYLFELLTSGRCYRAAGLLLAWPTLVLTAERFSTRVLWGSRIAMVQTGAFSTVDKSQGGTVRGRGRFILLVPRKNWITAQSLPTDRPAIGAWKSACAVAPWVPAVAERLGGNHRAEGWAIRGPGHPCSL